MGRELTAAERTALTGQGSGQPLKLEGCTVADFKIAAPALERAELRDVELVDVEIEATRFHKAVLDGVSMKQCRLAGVSFEECDFAKWSLEDCRVDGLRLSDCRIHRLRTVECRIERAEISGCTMEGWEDERSHFSQSSLRDLRIADTKWKKTELAAQRVDRVALSGGVLHGVTFIQTAGTGLAFRKLQVDGLSLSFGTVTDVLLEELKGRSVALNQLQTYGIRIAGCEIGGLGMSGSQVRGLSIERSAIAVLALMHTELEDLRVSDTQLPAPFFSESRIFGKSLFERVVLLGPEFFKSALEGLSLLDCTIDGPLQLKGSRVSGLKLQSVTRGSQYRLVEAGATYEGGDRFPAAP